MPGVKGPGGHDNHGHVDEPGHREGDRDLSVRGARDLPPFALGARRDARLRQPRMQVDRMRHDRRANDADREHERMPVGELRQHRMQKRHLPIDGRDEHFEEVGKPDRSDEGAYRQFDRPEAEPLQCHDRADDHAGDRHPGQERDLQQQRQPDGAAEEFGEIGRHRREASWIRTLRPG